MTSVASGLAARGIEVVTFDFLYMHDRRRVPDRAPVLEECFRRVIDTVRPGAATSRRLFIGGKSMGGRMATHLAAQRLAGLGGVVALGYPLHPPGKPDQPRTAHLPSIAAPVLIVQGEHDAFGTPAELQPVVASIHASVTLHVVSGGDHSLAVRGVAQTDVFEPVLDVISRWIAAA